MTLRVNFSAALTRQMRDRAVEWTRFHVTSLDLELSLRLLGLLQVRHLSCDLLEGGRQAEFPRLAGDIRHA